MRLSVRFSRREPPIRCCARPPLTVKTGSRASAGQTGLRRLLIGRKRSAFESHEEPRPQLGAAPSPMVAWQAHIAAAKAQGRQRGRSAARSLFVVVILVIVVFIVIVGLTGRVVRFVALVVPEL